MGQSGAGEVSRVQVAGVRHRGSLFDVLVVEWAGTPALMKVPVGRVETGASLFVDASSTIFSRLWSHRASTGLAEAPTRPVLEALLADEAARIAASGGAWNHEVLYAGRVSIEGRGEVFGVVMPNHPGVPLGALSRAEQRVWFPRVLPMLLRAISAQAHRDLSPSNILVDVASGRVALIDPGAVVEVREEGPRALRHARFITNTTHYPLLSPLLSAPASAEEGLEAHMQATLRAAKETRTFPEVMRIQQLPPHPLAADVHALGVMYYTILTGQHPLWDVAFQAPAWCGNEVTDDPDEALSEGFRRGVMRARREVLDPRALDDTVRGEEAALVAALLDVRVPEVSGFWM